MDQCYSKGGGKHVTQKESTTNKGHIANAKKAKQTKEKDHEPSSNEEDVQPKKGHASKVKCSKNCPSSSSDLKWPKLLKYPVNYQRMQNMLLLFLLIVGLPIIW